MRLVVEGWWFCFCVEGDSTTWGPSHVPKFLGIIRLSSFGHRSREACRRVGELFSDPQQFPVAEAGVAFFV